MNLVLDDPKVPPNTGNIARRCATTHLVPLSVVPLGFGPGQRKVKGAGMAEFGCGRFAE